MLCFVNISVVSKVGTGMNLCCQAVRFPNMGMGGEWVSHLYLLYYFSEELDSDLWSAPKLICISRFVTTVRLAFPRA